CKNIDGTLLIGSSVKYIGIYAFFECEKIKTLSFGGNEDLIEIGEHAFQHCKGLNGTVGIPSSVEIIGNNSFDGCKKESLILIVSNGPFSTRAIWGSSFWNWQTGEDSNIINRDA
ncbi:MAG: leucine-rich repeat protein, partial [Mycoplasma sp.]